MTMPRHPGRVWARILNATTFAGIAELSTVLAASTREAVNEVGSFTLTVPTADYLANLANLSPGAVLGLYHDGAQLLRGRIETVETSNAGDSPRTVISCMTLAVELVWSELSLGLGVSDISAADTMTAILTDTGWSQT